MKSLVGQEFEVEQSRYRILDTRNVSGVLMVYAANAAGAVDLPDRSGPRGSRRVQRHAFRYSDIRHLLPVAPLTSSLP